MSKLIEKLRGFISGLIPYAPIGSTNLGFRLETIKPTNLGIQTWRWIKLIIESAFKSVCDNLIGLSLSTGKQLGRLGCNAQYPYLQRDLRSRMLDDTITVHDGVGLNPMMVYPSANNDTVVIGGGVVVYPSVSYVIAPFVIHSDRTLTEDQKNRIIAETSLLKFAGMRYIIDYPQNQDSIPIIPEDDYIQER